MLGYFPLAFFLVKSNNKFLKIQKNCKITTTTKNIYIYIYNFFFFFKSGKSMLMYAVVPKLHRNYSSGAVAVQLYTSVYSAEKCGQC